MGWLIAAAAAPSQVARPRCPKPLAKGACDETSAGDQASGAQASKPRGGRWGAHWLAAKQYGKWAGGPYLSDIYARFAQLSSSEFLEAPLSRGPSLTYNSNTCVTTHNPTLSNDNTLYRPVHHMHQNDHRVAVLQPGAHTKSKRARCVITQSNERVMGCFERIKQR